MKLFVFVTFVTELCLLQFCFGQFFFENGGTLLSGTVPRGFGVVSGIRMPRGIPLDTIRGPRTLQFVTRGMRPPFRNRAFAGLDFEGLNGMGSMLGLRRRKNGGRQAYSGYYGKERSEVNDHHDKHLDKKNKSLDKQYNKKKISSHDRGKGFIKSWSWDKAYDGSRDQGKLNQEIDVTRAEDQGGSGAVAAIQRQEQENVEEEDE